MTHTLLMFILKVIVPIYIGLVFLLYVFQNKLIFYPQKTNPANLKKFSGIEYHVTTNEASLSGWFIKNTVSKQAPLLIYYGGNAEDISHNLWDTSYFNTSSFLFMNYRGYGSSTGTPSETSLTRDAVDIFDHIVQTEHISPEDIILLGRSLGSGIAVHVASQRPVRGVILVTPFDSILNMAKKQYPVFPVRLLLKHPFESVKLAPSVTSPVLMITGSNDTLIPYQNSHALFQRWGGPKSIVTIEGADHGSIGEYKKYRDSINAFLGSTNRIQD